MDKIEPILNDITQCSPTTTINTDLLGTLEKAIVTNYIGGVKDAFNAGETIYWKSTLCNGFYSKKYNMHPQVCHPAICNKTALYYALWCNTLYYSQIFSDIIEILNKSPILWFNSPPTSDQHDTRDDIVQQLSDALQQLYTFIISIRCSCTSIIHSPYYDQTSMEFDSVYTYLTSVNNFDDILAKFSIVYNFGEYVSPPSTTLTMVCHKASVGKFYIYDNSNSNNNCDYDASSHTYIQTILERIRQTWAKYTASCTIVKILLNQQAYEYYKYHLKMKFFKLTPLLQKIYDSDTHIDINYTLNNTNILNMTLHEKGRPELINKLIQLNALIPPTIKMTDIVKQCDISNIKEVCKTYKPDYFTDIAKITKCILLHENMMSCDKIDLINILSKRMLLTINTDTCSDILELIISHDLSHNFLTNLQIQNISPEHNLLHYATSYNVYMCIKYLKHRELDIILKYCPTLCNEKYDELTPLYTYFKEHDESTPSAIDVLKTLLLNRVSINNDDTDDLIMITAITRNQPQSFELLLKFGGDPYTTDKFGLNSFHHAIILSKYDTCARLITYNNSNNNTKKINIINTITNSHDHPLMLAMTCNIPIKMSLLLLQEPNIMYSYRTHTGDNLLFFLLSLPEMDVRVRTELFGIYMSFCGTINLLEFGKISMKPIIVEAVEREYYDIVVMIMNKLLMVEEITFKGYETVRDIRVLLRTSVKYSILVRDTSMPNFYSLVMTYLQSIGTRVQVPIPAQVQVPVPIPILHTDKIKHKTANLEATSNITPKFNPKIAHAPNPKTANNITSLLIITVLALIIAHIACIIILHHFKQDARYVFAKKINNNVASLQSRPTQYKTRIFAKPCINHISSDSDSSISTSTS